jgi:glycosyltransferase involved in cell wall biosynthesis
MPEPAPGVVVGGGIDTDQEGEGARFRRETGIEGPYMVYVGRLDRGKNTHLLVSYFRQWASREGREMKLVLIGGGDISLVPEGDPSVVYLGTPDEQLKMDAVAGASIFCQPSVNESFSRVIMEAWLCRVPVMVSADCHVTAGHCRRSGGGLYFGDYFEFTEGLEMLAADPDLGGRMGEAGRRYVLENYHWDRVTARFAEAAADLTGISPAGYSGEEGA